MATEFTLNNSEEFQKMINDKDFRIAQAIVTTILNNITTKKKHIHVLSVSCLEENATYDITLEKKHFVDTLEENLKYYIEHELYEDCTKIVQAINKLKETPTPTPKTTPKKNGKSKTISD
jgi:hypothetical protein